MMFNKAPIRTENMAMAGRPWALINAIQPCGYFDKYRSQEINGKIVNRIFQGVFRSSCKEQDRLHEGISNEGSN